MLNCKIVKGVQDTCTPNVAGVLRMAIANWDGGFVFESSKPGCVDTVDLKNENVYEFAIMKGTGNATSTGTVGGNSDSRYHQHSVTGQIAHLDCDLLGDYNNFFLGNVVIFVETMNRDVYVFGADNGLMAETWTYDTGTGDGDTNGVNFVFSGAQPNPPLKLQDWTVVEGLMKK